MPINKHVVQLYCFWVSYRGRELCLLLFLYLFIYLFIYLLYFFGAVSFGLIVQNGSGGITGQPDELEQPNCPRE